MPMSAHKLSPPLILIFFSLLFQDQLRPPIYNPEDYASALKKWGKRQQAAAAAAAAEAAAADAASCSQSNPSGSTSNLSISNEARSKTLPAPVKDYRNPNLTRGAEMSLRQFSSATELLSKLRADLTLAYPR